MNMQIQSLAFVVVGTLLCSGCESVKRVDNDPRYFGGFVIGTHYVTQKETIITPDKGRALYGEVFCPPKRLFLVPANTSAATNYLEGKFTNFKREYPVKEIGRLPKGTRLEFIGIETVVVPFDPPRPALPYGRVTDGPFKGNEVCILHLCSEVFVQGWSRTEIRRSDLGKGRQIDVFSPRELFLVPEPKQ